MSGGGGGGSSIIAAYAVIRNFIRSGRTAEETDERAELDAEVLREVEYESVGLPIPEHSPTATARSTIARRLPGSRLLSRFRRRG